MSHTFRFAFILVSVHAALLALAGCGSTTCPEGSSRVKGQCLEGDSTLGTGENAIEGDGGVGDVDAGDGDAAAATPECALGEAFSSGRCVRDRCITLPGESDACGEHSTCKDGTLSTPTCGCEVGYEREEDACVRNPCIVREGDDDAPCAAHATCSYRGGGDHECACEQGYVADGEECTRDVCLPLAEQEPPCGAHQACAATEGEPVCSCEASYGDCDADAANGCEVDLQSDAMSCGACGFACASGLACVEGVCETRVTTLSLGWGSTFALAPDGKVLGAGMHDRLLLDNDTSSFVVLPFERASAISTNANHACTVRANGAGIECWGYNSAYRLGASDTSVTRVQLASAGALGVAAGYDHSCVIAADGRVYCWGRGRKGEFGDGFARDTSFAGRTFADATAGAGNPVWYVEDAVEVRAGNDITCARVQTGIVYCWGYAAAGTVYRPELVRGLDNVPVSQVGEIALGYDGGCARRANGAVLCWSGKGSAEERNHATAVELPFARQIAGGREHTCALLEDDSVWCWGANVQGAFGSGDAQSSDAPVPALLPEGTAVESIHADPSALGTCARAKDGRVWCWGYNNAGALGFGDTVTPRLTPAEVTVWP